MEARSAHSRVSPGSIFGRGGKLYRTLQYSHAPVHLAISRYATCFRHLLNICINLRLHWRSLHSLTKFPECSEYYFSNISYNHFINLSFKLGDEHRDHALVQRVLPTLSLYYLFIYSFIMLQFQLPSTSTVQTICPMCFHSLLFLKNVNILKICLLLKQTLLFQFCKTSFWN